MAAHFRWYDGTMPETVPWFAKYSFPSEANKAQKLTPRITPKSGFNFSPGSTIRLEFPAQGYVNPGNTTLEFDVTLQGVTTADVRTQCIHFQNNINSLFQRGRVLYGSGVFEDIDGYGVVCRALTEWTGTNNQGVVDQTAIAEGQGGTHWGSALDASVGMIHTRTALIQGIDTTTTTGYVQPVPNTVTNSLLNAGAVQCTRRYQVTFAFGLFTQGKLIPTKWMASQFAIELTLNQPQACIHAVPNMTGNTSFSAYTIPPNYCISNVNLIPEILIFDSSYDEEFLRGLQNGGMPIKFSTWKRYGFSIGGGSTANFNISEKSRSVKSIYTIQRRSPPSYFTDSGAMVNSSTVGGTIQNYQYRIGGLYYPQSPVQCTTTVGGNLSNGGAEAFVELQKALNTVGDYRLSSGVNPIRWCINQPLNFIDSWGGNQVMAGEADFHCFSKEVTAGSNPNQIVSIATVQASPIAGNFGSSCFAAAVNLETSSGLEISGLNAEELSDITFSAYYSTNQSNQFAFEAYTYVDKMIVLKENNVVVLIE
jgi:hypothetical protein